MNEIVKQKKLASSTPNQDKQQTPFVKSHASRKRKVLHQKKWLILGLVASCLVILGGIFWGLEAIKVTSTQIQKLRSQAISVAISDQDIQLLKQVLEDTKDGRTLLIQAFPNEETLLNFIRLIDSIKGADIEVIDFSLESDVPTKIGRNPNMLPMSLTLKGSHDKVNQALSRITTSSYFIRTVSYVKEYNPNNQEQVVLKVKFHLFVADDFSKTKF